jgi:hypothetical protein
MKEEEKRENIVVRMPCHNTSSQLQLKASLKLAKFDPPYGELL